MRGWPSVPNKRKHFLAIATILSAQLILQMDFLIVMVALPNIQADLGFSPAMLSWVPNGFALAFGGLLLLGGRLGDIYGQVRIFRIGIAIFVMASLLGGVAQSASILVTARVLQGVGAALAAPCVLALLATMSRDESERNRVFSLFIAVSSIGASGGLILGGVLTALISWRWSLLINVPIGALVFGLIGPLVTETPRRPSRLDIAGGTTATLGSVSLVYGFINAAEHSWRSPITWVAFLAAAALIVTFYLLQKKTRDPLLDIKLLNNWPRVAALIVMACIVGVHFAALFFVIQFLQKVLHYGPLVAGIAYLPLTGTVLVITHFVPNLIHRFGTRRLMIAGSALTALSFVGFALISPASSYFPAVLLPLLTHSVGIALVFAPGTVAIMKNVPDEHAGTLSGLLQMDQQIGGAIGIAIIVAIYAAYAVPGEFIPGLSLAFMAAATIALCATVTAWLTPKAEKTLSVGV